VGIADDGVLGDIERPQTRVPHEGLLIGALMRASTPLQAVGGLIYMPSRIDATNIMVDYREDGGASMTGYYTPPMDDMGAGVMLVQRAA
jgi:hypothetical protein